MKKSEHKRKKLVARKPVKKTKPAGESESNQPATPKADNKEDKDHGRD